MKVLAVDADPQGSLALVLGLKPVRYLHDFLVHNCALDECVVPAAPHLDVLCSNRDTTKVEVALLGTPDRELAFRRYFSEADCSYDAVLIDVAPSISMLQTCLMMYAQRVLVPVAMDMLSLQGAVASLQTASMLTDVFHTEIRPVALLPVMLDQRYSLTAYVFKALEEMSEQYRIPLLGAIRTDGAVPKAARARKFLADYDPKCKALQDYTLVAGQLLGLLSVEEHQEQYEEALTA
jgi:chromosome partitioning protein